MIKLALGSAQFGLPYGVANESGQAQSAEVSAILELAARHGVDTIDTAPTYGESEEVLGQIGVSNWQVISKLPALETANSDLVVSCRNYLNSSLTRLRIDCLKGLILHRGIDLLGPSALELYSVLQSFKDEGLAKTIGVSVYSPAELERILDRFSIDLVQLPLSILDRSAIQSGLLRRLKAAGIEVHVRSVFLQGLLLMDATRRPSYFNRWSTLWRRWHRWLEAEGLNPLQACLQFALSRPEVDRVVVGVDSVAQLQQILRASQATAPTFPDELRSSDPDLINPSLWKLA